MAFDLIAALVLERGFKVTDKVISPVRQCVPKECFTVKTKQN